MLALAAYERAVCDGCGLHSSIADDDPYFTLEERVCPVCAQTEAELRSRDKREMDSMSEAATRLPSDGRKRYLRLLSLGEILAAKSVAEQAPSK